MKKIFLLFILTFCSTVFVAQTNLKFWNVIAETDIAITGARQIIPQKYMTYQLNGNSLKDKLWSAPNEKTVAINQSPCIISLPIANGQIQSFYVVEASIMEPGLANAYPQIKTFSIKGIDDPYANGKLDWNEFGFHGMIRSINGDIFLDPYCVGNTKDYITYYTSDFVKDPSQVLPEVGVIDETPKKKENGGKESSVAPCMGVNLKSYRFAVACTHEYAIAATGLGSPTKAQTLSKVVTTVNRVDGVYETEVAVRLVLVANDTLVLYTSAATDLFTGNNNANTLINESATVINANIGSTNYDIGHTFSTGGGGLAFLGCVCGGNKAKGITGSPSPVGDPYDIDYVAHEVGHQFSGNHTFASSTSSCSGNGNLGTSDEPGSGITIMAYAGICAADNLAAHSIAYFHAVSYDEIVTFTNSGGGNSCDVLTSTGNNPPVVVGSATFTVPKSTAFSLTGSATDPDGDLLTYQWEQKDNAASFGAWNSGNKPYFMSYIPIATPTRLFPKQSVVLSGNYTGTKGEYVPPTAQTLNFRLTARDNKMGGGGVCSASSQVIVSTAGPFAITYPNVVAISWGSGSSQTVTWNVNSTDLAPVNCALVDLLISYDTGNTFTTLVSGVANNGSLLITVPTLTATVATCRLKLSSVGNIFYDVNDKNFTITTAVGINEMAIVNTTGLTIAPNPFSDDVTIKAVTLDSKNETLITISDVLGNTILQEKQHGISMLNKEYSLEFLSSGLYFVTIKNGNRGSVARMIKN